MFSSLMITTIHAPLLFGVLLGLSALVFARPGASLWVAVVLLLASYTFLEGVPALPPIASKQKLFYFLLIAAPLAAFWPRLRLPAPIVVAASLLALALWLGWPKIGQGGLSALAPILPPFVGAALGSAVLARVESQTFVWPLTLFLFAVGGAALSAIGVFMGFAQVSGAFAAFIGGALLVLYGATLVGRTAAIGMPAITFLLLSFSGVVVLIGLFAPQINVLALGILSVTLVMPRLAPNFADLPHALRPVAQGLLIALPAALAVALAYLQSRP